MTQINEKNQLFTGLILVTGLDKPGIANAVFEGLAPFAVSLIDIDQIIINERLILTLLISLNPSHQEAIEADLNQIAAINDIDIACLFSKSNQPTESPEFHKITMQSTKLHPRQIAAVTDGVKNSGGNIENISRVSLTPLTISLQISAINLEELEALVKGVKIEGDLTIKVIN